MRIQLAFSILLALVSVSSWADSNYKILGQDFEALDFDFVAPIVSGDSDVPVRAGLIYYDIGAGLKVINPNGAVESISSTGSTLVVTPSSSSMLMASAKVSSGDSVSDETGDWINGDCTNATTGNATCSFVTGIFSDTTSPNCFCTVVATATAGQCRVDAISTTSVTLVTLNNTGTATNLAFNLFCMGPQD